MIAPPPRSPGAEPYVAAFRAYEWNEAIEFLADRFFRNCRSARKVILADESRGRLPIPARFETVSHTDDTERYGLRNTPKPQGSSLWFNVDYGPIILRDALPGYDYYLLSESDLAVNLDLEPMMTVAARDGIDFIARDVRPAEETWFWFANGKASYDQVWRSLLFFIVLSARAIDAIAEDRRTLTRRARIEPDINWPFCESFVPASLMMRDLRMAPLEVFAETSRLNFRPRLSLSNPATLRAGSLTHSVLGGNRFIRTVIAEHGPRYIFKQDPDGVADLSWEDEHELRTAFSRAFLAIGDHAGYTRFENAMSDPFPAGERPALRNLSVNKPAVSSSTSPFSNHPDPERDACGANGDAMPAEYGFHTGEEAQPWWMVDLIDECMIEEIRLVNRRDFHERFLTFSVESSRDTTSWITRYTKFDLSDVSSNADYPHTIRFADPFLCRFVRIKTLGWGMMHLRRVSVHGVVVYRGSADPGRAGTS